MNTLEIQSPAGFGKIQLDIPYVQSLIEFDQGNIQFILVKSLACFVFCMETHNRLI